MYNFIKDEKLLEISKIPIAPPSNKYKVDDGYKSYIRYIKQKYEQDIRDYIIPQLLQKVEPGVAEEAATTYMSTDPSNVEIIRDSTGHRGDEATWAAYVKINTFSGLEPVPFRLFQIPEMDETGILYKDGARYAIMGELVQDESITYDQKKGEIKFLTSGGASITIQNCNKATAYPILSNPKPASARNGGLPIVMFALATQEGLDPQSLLDKLRIDSILNAYSDEAKFLRASSLDAAVLTTPGSFKRNNSKSLMDVLYSDKYRLGPARDSLNEVLSIDRAENKVLSRDVIVDGKVLVPADTLVSSNILKQLKRNMVNEVYVKNVPNRVGTFVAEDVFLPALRQGTEMLPVLREIFPEMDKFEGDYLPHDLIAGDLRILRRNTRVETGLLEALAYNNYMSIKIKTSENSANKQVVYFEEEIIGNRCFRRSDISSKVGDSSYVYLQEDGTLVTPSDFLTAYDVLALISYIYKLRQGKDLDFIANRDLGLRKRVRYAYGLFTEAMRSQEIKKAFNKIGRKLAEQYKSSSGTLFGNRQKTAMLENACVELSKAFWKYLYGSKVLTTLETTNPVALYSSLSKIVSIVADSNAISAPMRSQSQSHYGRLCPYEMPQSKKLGVNNNKARGCILDEDGRMYTQYRKLIKIKDTIRVSKELVTLSVEEEEQYIIASSLSLDFNSKGDIITRGKVFARVPSAGIEKMAVAYVDIFSVDLINADPNQTMGDTASTIPALGGDDAARVTFETSMCKQAKGLINPEVPQIITVANIDIPRKSPYYQLNAEYDGVVEIISSSGITVRYDGADDTTYYAMPATEFLADSVIIRTPEVVEGQRFKEGDVLVSSNVTKEGYLAMGTNAFICFVPKGFNYEDGAFASKRIMHKLASYGVHKDEEEIKRTYSNYSAQDLDKFNYVEKGSVICRIKKRTKKGDISDGKFKSKKISGFIHKAGMVYKTFGDKAVFQVNSVSIDPIRGGDKIANRHGNKTVIPIPQLNSNMPGFLNGEFIDIAYNPTGVGSRMNLGQVLGGFQAFAAHVLGIRVRADSFNGSSIEDIETLWGYAWHLANDDDMEAVFKMYNMFPNELHQHCREYIASIRYWKNCFNIDGTANLYNPRTGKKYRRPVVIGVNYIYKLIHESEKKVNARGGRLTSGYLDRHDAPPKGASRGGGQKEGYMEIGALMAYGASSYLHELLNERGDNMVARNNLTVEYLGGSSLDYRIDDTPGVRRSTMAFIQTLAALGIYVGFDDELPNDTVEDNDRIREYKKEVIVGLYESKPTTINKDISTDKFGDELDRL